MERFSEINTISVMDVIRTLEVVKDFNEDVLTFASILTGISEDAIMGKIGEERPEPPAAKAEPNVDPERGVFRDNGVSMYLEELRKGAFKDFTDFDAAAGRFISSVAVLEFPYTDIELNLNAACNSVLSRYENRIDACYFCCLKDAEGEWEDYDYLDNHGISYMLDVKWEDADWLEQLRTDMEKKLKAFAKEKGFSLDKPNP